MCGGVKFKMDGQEKAIYFPQPNAVLPVKRHDGTVSLVTWGRRKEEEGRLPKTGWARLDSINAGKWDQYHPKAVKIPVDQFMEKDEEGKSHWYQVTAGQYIQGLLARDGAKYRVYVVTITPTLPEFMAIHDRWPRLISAP